MAALNRRRGITDPRMASRAGECGFGLIEAITALGLVSVLLASVSVFFVRSMSVTHHEGLRQNAVRVAANAIDWVHAADAATLSSSNGEAITSGEWTRGAETYLSDLAQPVWVPSVPPVEAAPVKIGKNTYSTHWFAGRCWRAGTNSDCTGAHRASVPSAELVRVVVAVTWPDRYCPDDGECVFVVTTMISVADDPIFPLRSSVPSPAPTAAPSPAPAPTAVPSPTPTAAPSPTPPAPPAAPLAAIWANRSTNGMNPAALVVEGSLLRIAGLVHSNADLYVAGSDITFSPRVEYGTNQSINAPASSVPAPVRVSASTPPRQRYVADYRPGGTAAIAAGGGYYAVPASACASGQWTYTSAAPASATIVYVPCDVTISSNVKALVVATGTITVWQPSITIGNQANPGATGLLSGSASAQAISISGSSTTVYGNIQALQGRVSLLGSLSDFRCGIVADTLEVRAASITITVDSTCA